MTKLKVLIRKYYPEVVRWAASGGTGWLLAYLSMHHWTL